MKIALGFAAIILLAAMPAHAQARGGAVSRSGSGGSGAGSYGGALSGVSSFSNLGYVPAANLPSTNVSGSDATFTPSTFVTFSEAIAQGNANIKEQSKTVAQAAAESRNTTKTTAKIIVMQDDRGNLIYREN